MTHLTRREASTLFLLLLTPCLLVGCPPKGRVDVYETTASEEDSPKVLMTALMQFSDEVPDRLIQDLDELPMIKSKI